MKKKTSFLTLQKVKNFELCFWLLLLIQAPFIRKFIFQTVSKMLSFFNIVQGHLGRLKFSSRYALSTFSRFSVFLFLLFLFLFVVSQEFFHHHIGFQLQFLTSDQYHPPKKTDNLGKQFQWVNLSICHALLDLVPFAQFKKREKYPGRSVTFACNFIKMCYIVSNENLTG